MVEHKNQIDGVTHWSAPFVEHLRTVHFALISVSAAVVLLVLTAKPYNPSVALTAIEKILAIKKEWGPDFIRQIGQSAPFTNSDKSTSTWELSSSSASREIPCAPQGGDLDLAFICEIPRTWTVGGFVSQDPRVFSPLVFPNTLAEFRDWWNSLAKSQTIYFADSIGEIESRMEIGYRDRDNKIYMYKNYRVALGMDVNVQIPDDRKVRLLVDGSFPKSGPLRFSAETGTTLNRSVTISLGTHEGHKYEVDWTSFANSVGFDVGEFGFAFRDLALEAGGRESLSLEDIRTHLVKKPRLLRRAQYFWDQHSS
jgi:hypothetical protein